MRILRGRRLRKGKCLSKVEEVRRVARATPAKRTTPTYITPISSATIPIKIIRNILTKSLQFMTQTQNPQGWEGLTTAEARPIAKALPPLPTTKKAQRGSNREAEARAETRSPPQRLQRSYNHRCTPKPSKAMTQSKGSSASKRKSTRTNQNKPLVSQQAESRLRPIKLVSFRTKCNPLRRW